MREVKIINTESPFFNKTGLGTKSPLNNFVCVYFDGNMHFNVFDKEEIEVVGPATVLAATLLAYNQIQGEEFHVLALVTRVRSICERDNLMDGTITKRLRELREDGVIDYEYVNMKYRKL